MLLHRKLTEEDIISYMQAYVINRSCLSVTCFLALFQISEAKSDCLMKLLVSQG